MWIKHHLGRVHQFVTPSDFLRRRYIEWGIPTEKIVVIPNGHRPLAAEAAPASGLPEGPRNRFAFFGQLVDNKGLLVLFDAVKLLRNRGLRDFTLDVYGSNLQFASEGFRSRFNAFLAAEKSGNGEAPVRFRGGYRHADLPRLMRGVDWVIVPSTWWEIFGMVVSEAFLFGKPVICSKIGAIGERVTDNVDGLHFRVGDAESLAATMARAMTEEGLWDRLQANVKPPPTAAFVARQHIELCYDAAT
jgi:glycosyltransferase involved in cell wall biosynthesis